MKKLLYVSFITVFCLVAALTGAEIYSRHEESRIAWTGVGGWEDHPVLGWVNTVGRSTNTTSEFHAVYDVNAHTMNDRPLEESLGVAGRKILVVGDSHTFAVGVSQEEAWPNVLESILFGGDVGLGTVYNAAVSGYNLGQYLLRVRQMELLVQPDLICVTVTVATDLYDLIPPSRGGFVYGGNKSRVYFELDESGELVEKSSVPAETGKTAGAAAPEPAKASFLKRVKDELENRSAFFRRFKRSTLAVWIAMRLGGKNSGLWPGPETAFRIHLEGEHLYRWRLAEAILRRLSQEARDKGLRVVLVEIPYTPQVYDEVWNSSYGLYPDTYDRWIVSKRLEKICSESGMGFVDVTPAFIEETRVTKKRLHYPIDGHPNVRGQRVIAETVANYLKKHPEFGRLPAEAEL